MEASGSVNRPRYYVLQEYYLYELLEIYRETRYTFKQKLKAIEKEIGPRKGNRYNIDQVDKIFTLIRVPGNVIIIK